jgi:hypothetical protein
MISRFQEDNRRVRRTLTKEQLLWLERYETVEELNVALRDFLTRYNAFWLIARHGYQSPAEAHRSLAA